MTTWIKDSHGLFDYQASEENYESETIYLENECRIYRNLESTYSANSRKRDLRP